MWDTPLRLTASLPLKIGLLPQKESLHRLQRSIFRWRWLLVSGRLTCLKWRIPASYVCCPQKVLGWNKHGCLIWIRGTWPVVEKIYDVLLDKILVPWDGYNKHRTIRGIYVGTGLKTVSVNSQQGFLHNKKNIYPLLHSLSSGMPQDIWIFFSKMWGYLLVRNCTCLKKTSCGTPLCAMSQAGSLLDCVAVLRQRFRELS